MSRVEQKNYHLNLFNFYGDNNEQLLENNLTRALAICLENDPILFDRLLRKILTDEYDNLFVTVGDSAKVNIGIQIKCKDFNGITKVVGIPLSVDELILNEQVQANGAEEPITDLSIQVDEKLIIFEVKRNAADCLGQLKNQLEKIVNYSEDEISVNYHDKAFSWGILMDLCRHTLKFQKDVNIENLFTRDFYNFLKSNYPKWFRKVPFREISFPDHLDEDNKQKELLEVRLNLIKQGILEYWNKERNSDDELVFNRANIPVHDYSWVDEINIEPSIDFETDRKFIALKVWPGDTKTQGYSIFKKGKPFEWPSYILNKDYEFRVQPYIKFSHMQGLCWVYTRDKENPKTHTKEFFDRYAGKWKRDKQKRWVKSTANWEELDQILNEVNASEEDWKIASEFNRIIEQSQRSYFYISSGFAVEVRMPYSVAEELDINGDKNPIIKELKTISETLLDILNDQFTGNTTS
jgi:hypothetical protein